MTVDVRVMGGEITTPYNDYGERVEVRVEPSGRGLPVALSLDWANKDGSAPHTHSCVLSKRQAIIIAHALLELAGER